MSKPILKSITKKCFFVDADDFNDFVEECYGGSFEFMTIEEANFNVNYEFSASSMAMDFDGEDEAAICSIEKSIRNGEYPNYCTHILFNILLKDGYIEEGDYMIKIEH